MKTLAKYIALLASTKYTPIILSINILINHHQQNRQLVSYQLNILHILQHYYHLNILLYYNHINTYMHLNNDNMAVYLDDNNIAVYILLYYYHQYILRLCVTSMYPKAMCYINVS